MGDETSAPSSDPSGDLYHWSARGLHPIILLYVAAIFAAFMALSYLVFHSTTTVKALGAAALASLLSVFLGVINKIEYRLTESGLEKRPLDPESAQAFEEVFQWDELNHVVPMKRGFKYYKLMDEPNAFRRFWKNHISDTFSGEVHVETEDRGKVLEILTSRAIPFR